MPSFFASGFPEYPAIQVRFAAPPESTPFARTNRTLVMLAAGPSVEVLCRLNSSTENGRVCTMKRVLGFVLLVFSWSLTSVVSLAAQDLVITNARIIVATGNVIDQGSTVIRGARIVRVASGTAKLRACQTT